MKKSKTTKRPTEAITSTATPPVSEERKVVERVFARVLQMKAEDPVGFEALLVKAAEEADAAELLRKQREAPAREAAEEDFEDFCRHFRIGQPSSQSG